MKMRINTGSSCKLCDDTTVLQSSLCNSGTVVVIRWSDIFVLTLYLVEVVISFAVFLCLLYFWKNRNSPLVKSCYSCPDNIIMMVLCLFCFLPMMHVGELSPNRCMFLSPVVNVVFAFYTGLLLTKTLSVQNLLKCQTPSANPDRRMAFCVFVVILQLIILATLPFSGFPNTVRFWCRGGVVTLCDIHGNLSVLSCMLYNWICLFVLSCISVFEALKPPRCQDLRRTENLAAVSLVGFFSYTSLTSCAYFNLQLENYMLVTALIIYVVYLINPVVCLAALYLPTIHRILVCLREHRNFQIKSKVMSPRRKSSAIEALFSYLVKSNFGPEQPRPLTRSSHSSGVSHLSYPSSLVCGVRESICVVGHARTGCESLYDNVPRVVVVRENSSHSSGVSHLSYPSLLVASVGHVRTGCRSIYDNVPRVVAVKETNRMSSFAGQGIPTVEPTHNEDYDDEDLDIEVTHEELKKWLSILKGLRSSDV